MREEALGHSQRTVASPDIRDRVIIRPLGETDSIEELTDIIHAAFKKDPGQPYTNPSATQTPETTFKHIRKGRCSVVVLDGRLIGLGIVYPPPRKRTSCSLWYPMYGAHLRKLAIHPDFQGKGIGTRLLAACERHAKDMGGWNLWGSSPIGSRQLSLYCRCGYCIAEYTDWGDTPYESAIFSKCLHESSPHGPLGRVLRKAKYAFSLFKHCLRRLGRRGKTPIEGS